MGEVGEGRNITHQQKKLNEDELREFRSRFGIPISDGEITKVPFYHLPENSAKMKYLQERRRAPGGYFPQRNPTTISLAVPGEDTYQEFFEGTGERAISTTMAFVRLLS